MFHRVDDPMELSSSRYFRMATRLHLRGGAVTAALAAAQGVGGREEWTGPASSARDERAASPSGVAEGTTDDIASLAAMSQSPGFPSIGYAK